MSLNGTVSVIVPVYNVEKYLGQLIESIQKQTYENIELILVDDGSPDSSGAICDEYADNDNRIIVVHKQNEGVSAARNDGLRIARGEWVLFCDSDDWLEPDAVEQLVASGDETGADVVFGDINMAYEGFLKLMVFYKDEFVFSDRKDIDRLIDAVLCKSYCFDPSPVDAASGCYGGIWNKIIRREMIEHNDLRFDVRVKGIYDDVIFSAYILALAKKVAYRHVVVYNYRQLSTSITHTFKSHMIEINQAIFDSWDEFMSAYGPDGRFEKPYYANVIRRLTASLGQYFFNPNNEKPLAKQINELNRLLKTEPYISAINGSEKGKLNNRFDSAVTLAARRSGAVGVYAAYELLELKKRVHKK